MKTAIVATTLALVGCGASAGIARADPPAPSPGPGTTMDHDGTYLVGTDIVPGTYGSAGPAGAGVCYWKRLGGANGGDIVDNALTKKPQVVQIDPGDKAFKTDGCQPWRQVDGTDADAATPTDAQVHNDIDILNGLARQFGGAQLPPP